MPPKLRDALATASRHDHDAFALVDVDQLTRLAEAQTADEARRHAVAALGHLPDGSAGPMARLVEALVARAEESEGLRRLAATDALTGVANRRGFDATLAREAARAGRAGAALSVVFVDVDGLKRINDSHGHEAGDAAIRAVAQACLGATRRSDFVARIGGDEFGVLLPETRHGEALRVGRRIERALCCTPVAGEPISASVGVASGAGDVRPEALCREADAALYARKRRRSSVHALGRATTYAFQQSSFSTDS